MSFVRTTQCLLFQTNAQLTFEKLRFLILFKLQMLLRTCFYTFIDRLFLQAADLTHSKIFCVKKKIIS